MIGVEERISQIIANELPNLSADPFGFLEVIVSVEDEFKIDIPDAALEKLQTVGDLVAIVKGFQA